MNAWMKSNFREYASPGQSKDNKIHNDIELTLWLIEHDWKVHSAEEIKSHKKKRFSQGQDGDIKTTSRSKWTLITWEDPVSQSTFELPSENLTLHFAKELKKDTILSLRPNTNYKQPSNKW